MANNFVSIVESKIVDAKIGDSNGKKLFCFSLLNSYQLNPKKNPINIADMPQGIQACGVSHPFGVG